ncbi:GNAT family N-acetyltransferase [Agaribacterium sp. ZY112]|uniref:GNAT family N-acetyltransferase n=1 Tax=Agaribacterium sp. ZY112 TaxID=3233574 RepID=UPI003523AB98
MHFELCNDLSKVKAEDWDALWPEDYIFSRHAFLLAFEQSGSVNKGTANNGPIAEHSNKQNHSGWQAQHLLGFNKDKKLVFVMPLYLKEHSYGEYVFDWAWAEAYMRCGLSYYPKLVNAIPFTPSCGPRWAGELDNKELAQTLSHICKEHNYSGVHSLFTTGQQTLETENWVQRQGTQFQWFNRNYQCFDEFLDQLSSRKRKNIRKERAKCQDLKISMLSATDLSEQDWINFYQLYQLTYLKRSGHGGYLKLDFFLQLAKNLPENIVLCQAKDGEDLVAAAVYFRDQKNLYGRYWGALKEYDGLHFECCYYQGINYAIAESLQRFCPGTQGEHKIQRGFEPVLTRSYHFLVEPGFYSAIDEFCQRERQDNLSYLRDARTYLPYKEGFDLVAEEQFLKTQLPDRKP